jgi:hypothetical protein
LIGQFCLGIVGSFDIRPQKARKIDRLAADLKDRAVGLDRDGHGAAAGIDHLTGNRSLPNQLEQPELIGTEFVLQSRRQLEGVPCRPNRFVGFLRIFDLRAIYTRRLRQELTAVFGTHQIAGRVDRHLRQIGRIGTHVRDVAVLV